MKELDEMHRELMNAHNSIEMQLDNICGQELDEDEMYDVIEETIVATKLFVIKNILLILESKMRSYQNRVEKGRSPFS